MSHTCKILIDSSSIKFPNGLWFYTLDLIDDLGKIGCDVYLVPPVFYQFNNNNVKCINKISAFILSVLGEFHFAVVPTLAIRFYRRQHMIIHDLWPITQPNIVKRFLANVAFRIMGLYSKIVAISVSHAIDIKSDLIIVNKFPTDTDHADLESIECDYLIIGAETARKNLYKAVQLAEKLALDNKTEGRLIIVGNAGLGLKIMPAVQNLKIHYLLPSDLGRVQKTGVNAVYISLSSEEGFNRGAAIALKKGFNLILSDIPAHKEFFNDVANFVNVDDIATLPEISFEKFKLREASILKDFSKKLADSLDSRRFDVLRTLIK